MRMHLYVLIMIIIIIFSAIMHHIISIYTNEIIFKNPKKKIYECNNKKLRYITYRLAKLNNSF